jgi:hypothetical protein
MKSPGGKPEFLPGFSILPEKVIAAQWKPAGLSMNKRR